MDKLLSYLLDKIKYTVDYSHLEKFHTHVCRLVFDFIGISYITIE